MNENAVNFEDTEALEKELAGLEASDAAAAEGGAKTKKPKEKKPKVIKVSWTADHDIKEGETVEFDYTLPASTKIRGVNAGIPVEEMTEEQLKIEYRNANSVLYKTKKAGRDATAAQARFDKVVAIMKEKGIAPTARGAQPIKVDAAAVAELIKSGQISVDELQNLLNADAE